MILILMAKTVPAQNESKGTVLFQAVNSNMLTIILLLHISLTFRLYTCDTIGV